ncbi:glycosyltransferase family 4 protein [Acidocella sp.]|jgi:glycosyltransferase involved in cell wall biosynthesis|uniref:glycosyltransferase family 4 protein n=1 Tax=Acidocella sp. TaxID=50710 RepID=UPI002F3ED7A6
MIERPITILQVLPKLDTGGAERVVIEIAEAIHATGHKVLIACAGGVLSAVARRAGAEIVEMPLDTKSPFKMRRNARRLKKLIAQRDVQLVHAHSRAPAWSAWWATQATGTPFVTTYHGSYGEKSTLKRRYNAVMARGDRVIAVSHFIAGLIRTRYGTDEQALRVIHGGVNLDKFDPTVMSAEVLYRLARDWAVNLADPVILLPGRLTTWKGQKILIQALAKMRHRDAVVILAGSAQGRLDYAAELMDLGKRLGVADRLRLVGHTEEIPAAMMLADVVVNASTDPEAFGRTIIEAQAMGRIVIATDHGGARETIISGETGFLVPPGDVEALAAILDAALDMPSDDRVTWGRHARAHVAEHYSVAAMQNAVLDVYAELLT